MACGNRGVVARNSSADIKQFQQNIRRNPLPYGIWMSRLSGGVEDPHLFPTFPQRSNPNRGAWLPLDILDIQ